MFIKARLNSLSTLALASLLGGMTVDFTGARADGFEVRPVTVQAKDGLASVTVSNPNDARIYIETSVHDWTQDSLGQDVLIESTSAIASPPAMWIPPHASYVVRLRLPKATGTREMPFRVAIQQVPDRDSIVAGHILFTVTQNLAVFSEPDTLAPPELHGRFQDGRLYIENAGGRRVRIDAVSQDKTQVARGLLGYALAGSRVNLPYRLHPGRIDMETDLGKVVLDVN